MNQKNNTRNLAMSAIFIALILLLGLVPVVGYIPIIQITTVHLPVMLGAALMGPKWGGILGFFFGLTSFFSAMVRPDPIWSPVFTPFYKLGEFGGNAWSLVICFVPRILCGVVAGFLFKLLQNTRLPRALALSIAGVLGTFTNTLLVLSGIYFFFGNEFAVANGLAYSALAGVLLSIVISNGLVEMGVAGLCTGAIGSAVLVAQRK